MKVSEILTEFSGVSRKHFTHVAHVLSQAKKKHGADNAAIKSIERGLKGIYNKSNKHFDGGEFSRAVSTGEKPKSEIKLKGGKR